VINSQEWPNVTIIILNWNGWKDTIVCLESLRELKYSNYQIVIVDNGSMDDSVERIKGWAMGNLGDDHGLTEYSRMTALEGGDDYIEQNLKNNPEKTKLVLIRNEDNLGFTGGNNVAIRYSLQKKCPADYVFVLNNDARVDKDCLINLIHTARKTNAGIVGSVLKDENSGEIAEILGRPEATFPLIRHFFHPMIRWPKHSHNFEEDFWTCFWAGGTAMLICKDVLKAVYSSKQRYFDDRLFLYGEEVEFCHIARQKGFKSITTKNAAIFHKRMGSSGGKYNPIAYYYINRNHILLAKSLLPLHWKLLFPIINIPVCLARVLKNLLYSRRTSARAVLCALVDGYRGVIGKWQYHDQEIIQYRKTPDYHSISFTS